jgi:hypothetical protein
MNLSTDLAVHAARSFLREVAQPWTREEMLGPASSNIFFGSFFREFCSRLTARRQSAVVPGARAAAARVASAACAAAGTGRGTSERRTDACRRRTHGGVVGRCKSVCSAVNRCTKNSNRGVCGDRAVRTHIVQDETHRGAAGDDGTGPEAPVEASPALLCCEAVSCGAGKNNKRGLKKKQYSKYRNMNEITAQRRSVGGYGMWYSQITGGFVHRVARKQSR